MSEAPRVDLPKQDLVDLDPSAPANQHHNTNGTATQSLQQSAIKTKDSILESEVSPQSPARTVPRHDLTPPTTVLSAACAPPFSLPNHRTAASHAMAAAANHPAVQNTKETVLNGEVRPVAQNVKAEGAKTRDEFADLANARQTPDQKTATGQNLTHYHSLFYRLLSWKNPRATGIAFAVTVLFIFAARYLNVIRYIFKALYLTLGATATAEVLGQVAIGRGLTSQVRPRQYFTIPKASLERLLDDVEQLINFFVIESQRIVFAENVYATGAAFFASLVSYFLIKFVPLWGLSLIATVITFIGPLIYIQNKEVIDAQLEKGRSIATQQATQLKSLANQHAGNAAKTVQGYTQQYTAKAQDTINQYRGRSSSPEIKKEDFPNAPNSFPAAPKEPTKEPIAEPAI